MEQLEIDNKEIDSDNELEAKCQNEEEPLFSQKWMLWSCIVTLVLLAPFLFLGVYFIVILVYEHTLTDLLEVIPILGMIVLLSTGIINPIRKWKSNDSNVAKAYNIGNTVRGVLSFIAFLVLLPIGLYSVLCALYSVLCFLSVYIVSRKKE